MNRKIAAALISLLALSANAETTPAYVWANALTLESITNLSGGVEKGTHNLSDLDLTLSIDTEAAGWWRNGSWFIYGLGTYGQTPSVLTGELQTLSNIEAYNKFTLYEFWYQQSFADGNAKLLVGLHDYNSTFYSLESAGLFTESSFGIGVDTSQVGPSIFPTSAATIHLTLTHDDLYALLAVYDGIPGDPEHIRGTHVKFKKSDGLFKSAEFGIGHEKNYKLALGTWQHTAEVENPIDGSLSDSNSGVYAIGEKFFTENIAAFFQYGKADSDKNQLDAYFGAGVVANNVWVDEDAVGLAIASAHNGAPFRKENTDFLSAENVWELTYHRPIVEKINIQTSLYYVEHPSMDPALKNAVALGLRLYFDF